jgi:hypothetical protein
MVRYRQESWVDWNRDEAMQNLQSSIQAKALNANICSKTTKNREMLFAYKIMRNFASESMQIMTNVETSQRELKIKFNRVNPYRE